MFITKHVFLAHSEIEHGANKMGIELTVFKKPIEFTALDGKKRYAKIILTLSAQDHKAHIRLLNDIMTIFSESENEEMIWKSETAENIKNMICQLL